MEDSTYDDDPNSNPQLTKIIIMKSVYRLNLDTTNKKINHIIDHALKNTEAYILFFQKLNHFALTFNFLTPKERDIYSSHEVML